MTNSKGHVYLIDDDISIRSSLTRTLVDAGYAVQDFARAKDFMENLMPVSPAVILLDMQMPDLIGLDLQEQLTELGLKTPIIFISGQSHKKQIVQGLKNGAIDFLFKPFNLTELFTAIDTGLTKDQAQMQKSAQEGNVRKNFSLLTPREKEVCHLLVKGFKNKEIAKQFNVVDATIKVHKARIMEKMHANSLQNLVTLYLQFNLEQ